MERFAAEQLRRLLRQQGANSLTSRRPGNYPGRLRWQGRLEGKTVPGAARLAKAPNKEQAYVITSLGDNSLSWSAWIREALAMAPHP